MKIDWKKAALAGIVGTIAFDLIGLAFTGTWWDIPRLLGSNAGGGLAAGVIMHYINGILIAFIYAGVGPSLWGPGWARALLFITAQAVFGVGLFMMPLLGMGVFGLAQGALAPISALVRHWGYGLVLAWLYPLAVEELAEQQAGVTA